MTNELSNMKPDFTPRIIPCGEIRAFQYAGTLASELESGGMTAEDALLILEDMLIIREFEEMIVKLRSGAYEPLVGYDYRGPTHVSIGQEATAVGACFAIDPKDYITSTHRGHGDSIAKGTVAIRAMDEAQLRSRIPESTATAGEELTEAALEDHIFRTIAELFGKEAGYCKGRGGGMHIADFTAGHLGANAIVGGGVPISTGAAYSSRYLRNGRVVCCFAGDGAYANGVVLECLNWANQSQFTNHLAKECKQGLPMIFFVVNNHYAMTGRSDEEVLGIDFIARRGCGFAENNMHAEVVNGMDVLAVREAVKRAAVGCREGSGPYLIEVDTYRYYGHSLSDPRNEYRTREEEELWRALDPILSLKEQLLRNNVIEQAAIDDIHLRVEARNARAAVRASEAADPDASDVIKYLYTDTTSDEVPESARNAPSNGGVEIVRKEGNLTYKDALKEALYEEMLRDRRVIFYGEDVADYGGAFKVTKGLLEAFGRERVFNTPISEAAICGTAVGKAMTGLRPIAELMYMDFALMSGDTISNQASKWHYMSGANAELPLVYRVSVGGGKGYGGQHSQTLESVFAHIPGLYVVYPATPYDAKGLLKSAIRTNNPVMFIESQITYNFSGPVPEEEYLIPIGEADVKRAGTDVTIVTWGPALHDVLKAAATLAAEGTQAEVIDIRTLVPLDKETILNSVRKTGRCVVVSHAVNIGSYTGEIASTIMAEAFDFLDAPVLRVGAANGIAPQSHILEKAFLPDEADILAAAREVL
jgi:2-oxoisovalerate dehydrogenase E1 component